MKEKEEKSAGTKKAPKTRFQVFPSTSDSHSLEVWLREGEPLQNIPVLCRSAGAEPRGTAGRTLQAAVQVFAAVTLTRAR